MVGHRVASVGRRAKYLIFELDDGNRLLLHLSQAGRLDIEEPPKKTRPKGAAVRIRFDNGRALCCASTAPSARPRGGCSPRATTDRSSGSVRSPSSDEFAELILHGKDKRRIHTILRDQRTVSGIGRGYADDALHRAHVSPYATLASLSDEQRAELLDAIRATLADALEGERERTGGLSEPRLGRAVPGAQPCRDAVSRNVATGCAGCRTSPTRSRTARTCQTGGKVLADRRMSRLVEVAPVPTSWRLRSPTSAVAVGSSSHRRVSAWRYRPAPALLEGRTVELAQ